MDPDGRELVRNGQAFKLTSKEAEVLRYLLDRLGSVVTRADLERDVWGMAPGAQSATAAVTVRRLRAKLEPDPGSPRYLQTLVGVGWRLELPKALASGEGTRSYRSAELPRPDLLEVVNRALERGARLLTLTGAPGVGKTRLAVGIARRWAGEVVFVSLEDAGGRTVREMLARGVGEVPDADVELAISARRQPLVVLDGAGSCLVDLRSWLLESDLQATVLVTSPEALGSAEEWVLQVPLLEPEEVGALVALRTANPTDFTSLLPLLRTPLEVEICVASGVAPARLAAELTAGRLPGIEVTTRLERQGSLHASLTTSWNELEPGVQAVLLVCSFFVGALQPALVEACCGSAATPALLLLERRQWVHGDRLRPVVRAFLLTQPDCLAQHQAMLATLLQRVEWLLEHHDTGFEAVLAETLELESELEHVALTGPEEACGPIAALLVAVLHWVWSPARLTAFLERVLPTRTWCRLLTMTLARNLRKSGRLEDAVARVEGVPTPAAGEAHEGAWWVWRAHRGGMTPEISVTLAEILETREPPIHAGFVRGVWLQHLEGDADVSSLARRFRTEGRELSGLMLQFTRLFLRPDRGGADALLARAAELGLTSLTLEVRHRLALYDAHSRPERARLAFDQLLTHARRGGDRVALRRALVMCGLLAYFAGDLETALDRLEAVERFVEPGSAEQRYLAGYLWAVRTAGGRTVLAYDRGWRDPEVARMLVRGPDADVGPLVQLLEAEHAAARLRLDPEDAASRRILDSASEVARTLSGSPDFEVVGLTRRVGALVTALSE